jgi:hypothetical protein
MAIFFEFNTQFPGVSVTALEPELHECIKYWCLSQADSLDPEFFPHLYGVEQLSCYCERRVDLILKGSARA